MKAQSEVPASPVRRERSREIKRSAVISAARQARLLSRSQLTELTGLSPATLTPLVRELIAEGYLIERGADSSRAGRPRERLEFNPRAELVAAVALQPHQARCEIADSDGTVIAHDDVPLGPDIVATICDVVPRLAGAGRPELRGVAVAVPGVTADGEVRLAPSVGVVETRSIGEGIRERLGVSVVVDNDVNLMVAGEHAAGAGSDVRDLMLLHVTDGVGAGLMLDGRVRRGASSAAGEVGFMTLDRDAHTRDGVGAFEARWSESAVARHLDDAGIDRDGASPVTALVTAAAGDGPAAQAARAYLDEVLVAWSRLIISCACVVDPGRVLLSGAAAELDDAALARLQDLVDADVPAPVEIRRGALGERAVLHGAISSALTAAGLMAVPAT
ncbi:ROK family protein [Jiangella rhizosphaerae]|uniref:ROK family protein n=1 Tax=Jiangella rhizosphaerae TaxID=2293569 RepID=A0A418KMW2_9ACTN|nr:ROK family protein [Jiangella rhizosphaerae]RIQ20239.1 ROK family protein [Jiangella rhizosphaerae]